MRYALKFAYDGTRFDGYARQPQEKTIEGEILEAMERLGIIEDARASNFQSASRTDKGVSAAGNVIAINTGFDRTNIIPALNSRLDGVVFYGIADVDDDFKARHAKQRWYRYVLLKADDISLGAMRRAALLFIGTNDFRLFSKKDTGEENTVLTVDSVDVSDAGDYIIVDVRARRFLWQMVRRVISVMVSLANRELEDDDVRKALAGEKLRRGIAPAPPENLILMDVIYGFEFECLGAEKNRFCEVIDKTQLKAEALRQIRKIISSA